MPYCGAPRQLHSTIFWLVCQGLLRVSFSPIVTKLLDCYGQHYDTHPNLTEHKKTGGISPPRFRLTARRRYTLPRQTLPIESRLAVPSDTPFCRDRTPKASFLPRMNRRHPRPLGAFLHPCGIPSCDSRPLYALQTLRIRSARLYPLGDQRSPDGSVLRLPQQPPLHSGERISLATAILHPTPKNARGRADP